MIPLVVSTCGRGDPWSGETLVSAPWVAGVAGGVGTTTVAWALAAVDCGAYRGGRVHAVVCRDTVSSVGAAHTVVNRVVGRPVLLVVASIPGGISKPAAARVEMVRPHVASVVHVPFVGRWRELVDPWTQAAMVLRYSERELPRHVWGFRRALAQARTDLLAMLREPVPTLPPQTQAAARAAGPPPRPDPA